MNADFQIDYFRAAWEEQEQFFVYFQEPLKEFVKMQHMLCCQKNQVRHCCFEDKTSP